MFVCYSVLFVIFDVITLLVLPDSIFRATAQYTGKMGSLVYLMSLALMLGGRAKGSLSLKGREMISSTGLRHFVFALMTLEILRFSVAILLGFYAHGEFSDLRENGVPIFRVVVSFLLPSAWIRVWYSKSTFAYLRSGDTRKSN